MYFLSILFIAVGVMLFWVLIRGYALSKGGVLFCACYSSLMGLGMLISAICDNEVVFVFIFSIGFGGGFVATSLFAMMKPFFCRQTTTGEYQGAVRTNKGWYVLKFTYCANGKKYHGQSSNIYREWAAKRRFRVGESYQIWYSEKNPAIFTERRTVKFMYVWILVLGLVFCFLPFYMYFK